MAAQGTPINYLCYRVVVRKLEVILPPLSLPHPLWSTAQFCDAYCCKLLMYLCLITAMHKCMREVLGDAFVNGNSMMPMRLSLPASVQAAISSFDSDPQLGMGEALNSFVLLCAGVALNGFTLRLIGVPGVPRLLSLLHLLHEQLLQSLPLPARQEVRWQRRRIQETHLPCKGQHCAS